MTNTVLITGCCGRLGKRIYEALARDFDTIGLDLQPPDKVSGIEKYYQMNLEEDTSVRRIFSQILETHGNQICSVIHLAAHYSFGEQSWEPYQKITIDGTKRLLRVLSQFQVEQFIFSSTQLVYSPCRLGQKIDESSPIDPKWEYPLSKVLAEKEIFKMHGASSACILRISGVYDDFCHSIPLSHQIQRIYEDRIEKHFFPGNLQHGAPYLHMKDLVYAVELIVKKRNSLPKELALLLGEEKTYSYEELQNEMGRLLLGKKFSTYQIPKWLAKWGAWMQNHVPFVPEPFIKPWMIDLSDDHYELDLSLSKKLLDWQPERDIMETLPKMIQALKDDPDHWYKEHQLKR